jgi:hypothetical protein
MQNFWRVRIDMRNDSNRFNDLALPINEKTSLLVQSVLLKYKYHQTVQ